MSWWGSHEVSNSFSVVFSVKTDSGNHPGPTHLFFWCSFIQVWALAWWFLITTETKLYFSMQLEWNIEKLAGAGQDPIGLRLHSSETLPDFLATAVLAIPSRSTWGRFFSTWYCFMAASACSISSHVWPVICFSLVKIMKRWHASQRTAAISSRGHVSDIAEKVLLFTSEKTEAPMRIQRAKLSFGWAMPIWSDLIRSANVLRRVRNSVAGTCGMSSQLLCALDRDGKVFRHIKAT